MKYAAAIFKQSRRDIFESKLLIFLRQQFMKRLRLFSLIQNLKLNTRPDIFFTVFVKNLSCAIYDGYFQFVFFLCLYY